MNVGTIVGGATQNSGKSAGMSPAQSSRLGAWGLLVGSNPILAVKPRSMIRGS